jgi:hypothetical protein
MGNGLWTFELVFVWTFALMQASWIRDSRRKYFSRTSQ